MANRIDKIFVIMLTMLCMAQHSHAQVFSREAWEQKSLVVLKMSQLYYEANVGINVSPGRHAANFVYMGFGYGKPTRKNVWRKFLPTITIPSALTKEQEEIVRNSSTSDVHAGKISVGWNHWFSHVWGFYVQAGWGFIADLSTGDDLTDDIKQKLGESNDKRTFIYNAVPVELGLTLNMWKHCHVQAGFTYMWKEIPLFTFGLGYAF